MNKTLTEIKKEFEEKFAENLSGTGLQRPPYITKYTYTDEIWTWFELKIKEIISQTKQELIEQLDDIIELWFAVHDKTEKSFMTDDFRKFVKDKLK